MKLEEKHREKWEAGIDKKKGEKKKQRSRRGGWYGEVTSHWYRGGGRAWASREEGVEGNLKTVKNLFLEDDRRVENRAKRKCAGGSDRVHPKLRNIVSLIY